MIMDNFYRGVEYSPKNVKDNVCKGEYIIYRGRKI